MSVRIIFVPEAIAFGGAERSILGLVEWLHSRAAPHQVVLYFDRVNLRNFSSFPLKTIELKPRPGWRNKVASLRDYFRSLSNQAYAPLMSGYQAAMHASLAGLRGFHTLMHDTPSLFSGSNAQSVSKKLRRSISDWIVGQGLRSGGQTIVTSEYLRDECRSLYACDAKIARMGGMGKQLTFRPRIARDELRLLSVSRLEANKRIDWIIQSLAELEGPDHYLTRRRPWHLDVVGSGPLASDLEHMASDLGIGSHVSFHGFVDDAELESLYDRADLFLMPARQGYGIPAVEALQRGIPVLVHRESGVSDILCSTEWAVVARGGPQDLTGYIREALDLVLRGRHLAAPLPHIPTEQEWAKMVSELCAWG